MNSQEMRQYFLACQYLPVDDWYDVFISHDCTTRPHAMIERARQKYVDDKRKEVTP